MMKGLYAVALALTLAGCASSPTVYTDSDPKAQFSQYQTFQWLHKPEHVPPLFQQRIIDQVNQQLQAKGWRQVDSGAADVQLAAHVATRQKQTIDTFYSAPYFGGYGWRQGFGTSTSTVRTYDVGTLVIDMFDARTRQAVWRGTASGTIPDSPEHRIDAVNTAVTEIFKQFPPERPANR